MAYQFPDPSITTEYTAPNGTEYKYDPIDQKWVPVGFVDPILPETDDDNLQAEDAVTGQVFEASVGFKLSKHKEWWLDMGILPSHIGFESAIGADQLTLTRSMMADNSPYYESGFRLSYNSSNQKWFLALLCVNGWQRSIRAASTCDCKTWFTENISTNSNLWKIKLCRKYAY